MKKGKGRMRPNLIFSKRFSVLASDDGLPSNVSSIAVFFNV